MKVAELLSHIRQIDGDILRLRKENERLQVENEELQVRARDGTLTVEAILKRGVSYYDPSLLDYAGQVTYRKNAEEILRNEVFNNELQHLEADWVEFCAKGAQDYGQVRDMRMCLTALTLFKARLRDIPIQAKRKDDEESLFDPI